MLITLGVALDTSPPASELLRGDTGDQENAETRREQRLSHCHQARGGGDRGPALSTPAQPSQEHDNSNIS